MVIPEGTTGELTFIAMWVEAPAAAAEKPRQQQRQCRRYND
jgi:hypothetical protein